MMTTHRSVRLLLALASVVFLFSDIVASRVEKLEIDFTRDAKPLPYTLVEMRSNDWGARKRPLPNFMQVYRAQGPGSDSAIIVHAFNRDLTRDDPAEFSFNSFTQPRVIDHDPIYVTISGFSLYNDTKAGKKGIAGGCYRNDSAFVVKIIPGTDRYDMLYLASGVDRTGNGAWEGSVAPVLTEDYDFDGRDEVFFYLDPGRDLKPRVLYCIEPENMRIEWSLPVAAPVSAGNMHSCRDSLDPAVIFATYNYKNRVEDENFSDRYCYLAKINHEGRILYKRIISEEHGSKGLWRGERDGLFYVFHALPMMKPEDTGSMPPHRYQLSKIDGDCHAITSIDIPDRVRSAWLADYGNDDEIDLYTLSYNGTVRVFDTSLALLAESDETDLDRFLGAIRVEGQRRPALLFGTSSGVDMYSHDLKRLGNFGKDIHNFHPVVFDDRGNVSQLIVTRENAYHAVQIGRRGPFDYARILFWEYENHILLMLLALLVGLISVNYHSRKVAKGLTESQKKFAMLFRSSPEATVYLDCQGSIVDVNPVFEQLFGLSLEQIKGEKINDLIVPDGLMEEAAAIDQNPEQYVDYDTVRKTKDGRSVPVSLSISAMRVEGRLLGHVAVYKDITERKRTEEALRESEERYRSLIESASEAIFTVDRSGVFRYMNGVAARRLGGKAEELIGRTMWDLFPQHVAEKQMGHIRRVFESGKGSIKETVTELQGRKHWYHTSTQPIRDQSGAIVSVLGVARDITSFVQTKQELKSERDFIHSLLDTANSLIFCLDNQARITAFNSECERVTGYTRQEVMGKNWPEIFLPEEARHDGLSDFAEWVRQHPQDTYESLLRTKSGQLRTILWSNSALFSLDSDELTAIAVGQDITERKRAEEVLATSLRYEKALADCSQSLLVAELDTEEAIASTLQYLVRASQVSRVYIFENFEDPVDGLCMHQAHEACAAGVTPEIDNPILQHLPYKEGAGRWQEVLSRGEPIMGLVESFPATEREGLEPQGILSILVLPIWVDGKWYGFIGFDDTRVRRRWSDGEVRLLRTAAEMIGAYIERRWAEAALKTSEARYQELFDSVQEGIGIVDENEVIRFCNPAYARIFDHDSVDDLVGKNLLDFVPEGRRDFVLSQTMIRKSNRTSQYELDIITAKGNRKTILVSVSPRFDEGGNYTGAFGAVIDITERKLAETALQESEAKFRSLAETTTAAIIINQGDRLLYTNAAAEDITGYSREELQTLSLWEVVHPDSHDPLKERGLARQRGEDVPSTYEVRLLTKDGKEKWVDFAGVVIEYDGQPAVLGTAVDITERRKAETELRRSEQERYNQAKEIAGGIAHEIYNSLFPATSTLDKLRQRLDAGNSEDLQRDRRLLELAQSAVARAIRMTEVVTRFSRLESEKKVEAVDVKAVFEEIMRDHHPQISRERVAVKMDVQQDCRVNMNRMHAFSLFSNIIANALDALCDAGGGEILIKARKDGEDIRIKIADSGTGIPEEILSRVFDPFFSTKPRTGTGLGLAICKKIVDMYGGRISAASELDTGTRFTILIPSL